MKAHHKQTASSILICFLLFSFTSLYANSGTSYITISGIVKDQKSNKKLEYVNVSVSGTGIGTITNEDGRFTIKINDSLQTHALEFSRIGYYNKQIAIGSTDIADITILMTVNAKELPEVVVQYADPLTVLKQALEKIDKNYSPNTNLLIGFYRETVKKGRNYIDISEAVIDIYKTPYSKGIYSDRVEVVKGRKLLSQKVSDTLAVKLVGGPVLSVSADVVKNPDFFLSANELPLYQFSYEDPVMIEQRPHLVIKCKPVGVSPHPLFNGKIYIDRNSLTISKVELSLDMDDKAKVTTAILRKKPAKLRFKPEEVSFIINYKQHNGVTYLNYIENVIRFKCDWKRRLFSTNYTVVSEMIVTDIKSDNILKISNKSAFRNDHALTDKVRDFYDENFWEDYNIIEPSESLESAINKLKKQYK